jgi:queuine tRNA-ribosyltransferase
VDRTAHWAGRARAAFAAGADERAARGIEQAQFGIVQGGTDLGLRAESAERTVALDFDGYAVGGLSVGESSAEMLPALAATIARLPADQPRYLMGVGDPAGIVEAVGLGIDMFDCVLPTRHARHGSILTDAGKLSIGNARFAHDPGPLDPSCACPVCARWSRAYLRHLLKVGEPTGPRLLTIHNLAWLLGFVARLGEAVRVGRFSAVRAEILATWGARSAL